MGFQLNIIITHLRNPTLFLLLATYSLSGCIGETATHKKNDLSYLKLLGKTNEGRLYFVGSQATTWKKANADCKSAGLDLATVETTDHADFLKAKLSDHYPGRGYWTSALESLTVASFVWSVNGTSNLDATLIDNWSNSADPYFCVIVHAKAGKLSFSVKPCSAKNWLVLCQSP